MEIPDSNERRRIRREAYERFGRSETPRSDIEHLDFETFIECECGIKGKATQRHQAEVVAELSCGCRPLWCEDMFIVVTRMFGGNPYQCVTCHKPTVLRYGRRI